MKTMKQFGLAALVLVIGATLCATAAAGTHPLGSTGAEPGAAGQYTLAKFKLIWTGWSGPPGGSNWMPSIPWQGWSGSLTVTCQGLTPGAHYSTSAGQFNADRNGNGSVTNAKYSVQYSNQYQYGGWFTGQRVMVYRVNPDGSKTLVLMGAPFPYPPR